MADVAAPTSSRVERAKESFFSSPDNIFLTALFFSSAVGLVAGSTILTHPSIMETHLRIPSLGDLRIFEHYGAIIVVEALAAMLLFLLSGGVTGGRRAIRPVTAAFIAAIIASIPLAASYQELVMNREWHTATSAEAEAFESSHPKQSLVTAPSSVLADVAAAVQRDRGKALLFSDSHLLLPHSRWHVFALLSVFPVVYGLAFTLAATVFPFWSPFLAPPPA